MGDMDTHFLQLSLTPTAIHVVTKL